MFGLVEFVRFLRIFRYLLTIPNNFTKMSTAVKSSSKTPIQDKNKQPSQQPEKKQSEFLCKVKYYNNLPDIPLEPKLLQYPFDPLRFVKYSSTSLEKNYKHVIHTEPDVGITIDLIDTSVYKPPATRKYQSFRS